MGRYSESDSAPVYALAARWRDACLIEDGSLLFPDQALWTGEVIGELYRRYNENLQTSPDDERDFAQKFQGQLGTDRLDVIRLAAEVLAVYFLFATTAINGPRKRELIGQVLSWGGDTLDESGDVAQTMNVGVGNPGQGYNNLRYKHIAYFVDFARRFKELDHEQRRSRIANPWTFKDWLVEGDGGEQMARHLLLHLLFPDAFERIATGDHKARIHDAFAGLLPEPVEDVDRALLEIRERVCELMPAGQPQVSGHVDFYYPPLHEAWNPDDPGGDPDAALTHLSALETKRAVVLYGPPGTGKTYEAKALAARLIEHQALVRWGPATFLTNAPRIEQAIARQVRRVQLHQAWSYEQFIGGLKLAEGGGTELQEGYLPQLLREMASAVPGSDGNLAGLPWVLVLDELNRTDLSRLLGEAFSAMDDRGAPVDVAGLSDDNERRTLTFPENLYVVGTMNLIDQSVEQLDFALRRRFLWLYAGFQPELISKVTRQKWSVAGHPHHPFERLDADIALLTDRARRLNAEISSSRLLGQQYEIGHTYFFDIVDFIGAWPKVRPRGQRPSRYLWKEDGKTPLPPVVDLWRFSLKPLLDEYLAGNEPEARDREVARLRDIFLRGQQ